MNLLSQVTWLFVIAMPIACVAWTVTHEEIFAEPREYCRKQSQQSRNFFQRKFFYVFTCEYCFSFYVTVLFLLITHFKLLYADWKGYLISFFCLIWVANFYMSLFFRIRMGIKKEGIETEVIENKNQLLSKKVEK